MSENEELKLIGEIMTQFKDYELPKALFIVSGIILTLQVENKELREKLRLEKEHIDMTNKMLYYRNV